MHASYVPLIIWAWLAPGNRAAAPARVSPAAPARKHVGLTCASGDRLHLPASDAVARQEGEEGKATLDLILKHIDTTIVIYV
jgi:hypothetical protein